MDEGDWQDLVDEGFVGDDSLHDPTHKRQRASKPKVKTGCRTCKARRVKCDEAKPACNRCSSTGRRCEGYEDLSLRPKQRRRPRQKREPQFVAEKNPKADFPAAFAENHPRNASALTTMRPAQSIVTTDATLDQVRSYDFFRSFTVNDLSALHEYKLWVNTVMPAALVEPAIYHAIIALGMMHEKLLNIRPISNVTVLKQYNQAVVALTNRLSSLGDYEVNKVALITCLVFTMIESLFKSPIAARKQLEYGIKILSSWQPNRISSNVLLAPPRHVRNGMPDSIGSTEDDEIVEKFARMDLITARFMGRSQQFIRDVPLPAYFNDVDAAYHYMTFQNNAINTFVSNKSYQSANPYTSPEIFKEREERRSQLLQTYMEWRDLLDHLVSIIAVPAATTREYRVIRNMRVYYSFNYLTISCIHLSEMTYDRYVPEFEQALINCRDLRDSYSADHHGTIPTLSLDCGFTGCLIFTGMKCRHPQLRRQALDMLRTAPPHNSFIQSTVAARFIAKVIELEERDLTNILSEADVPEASRFLFIYQTEAPDLKSAVLRGMRLLPDFKPLWESHVIQLDNT